MMISLSMPKLLLTFFIGWIGYTGLTLKITQLSWQLVPVYLAVSVALVYLYLSKEIKDRAADLSLSDVSKRSWALIGWAFTLSAIMGAIVLTLKFQDVGRLVLDETDLKTVPFILGQDLALQAWLSATIFVFFTGLFVNLLFAGRKFTGF